MGAWGPGSDTERANASRASRYAGQRDTDSRVTFGTELSRRLSDSAAYTSDADDDPNEADADGPPRSTLTEKALEGLPPNPVLLALQLASKCVVETNRFTRDSVVTDRLLKGSNLLEHVASGILQGAVRATLEKAESNRAFNPWLTGKDAVEPRVARDYFVRSSLHHAAEWELKIFISNPFVYAYMQDLFWPEPPTDDRTAAAETVPSAASNPIAGAPAAAPARAAVAEGSSFLGWLEASLEFGTGSISSACPETIGRPLAWLVSSVRSVAIHLVALPVLLVIPPSIEMQWELQLREAIAQRRSSVMVVWFFPAGRFALWSISSLVSVARPPPPCVPPSLSGC